MNPFQSDNIWKKKARQGKTQQHPLTPQQEWQKQVNSSSLWLGGGVVLLALYLAAVRAGTVALDASAVVLIVVVGCFRLSDPGVHKMPADRAASAAGCDLRAHLCGADPLYAPGEYQAPAQWHREKNRPSRKVNFRRRCLEE